MKPDPTNPADAPRRFRRRAIASVLWALALGAATTIAIAWTLAGTTDIILHPGDVTFRRSPRAIWSVQEYQSLGARSESWTPFAWPSDELDATEESLRSAAKWSASMPRVIATADLADSSGDPVAIIEHARGWPLIALGSARINRVAALHAPTSTNEMYAVWGLPLWSSQTATWDIDLIDLPLRPLFPGFYLNTALFASLWWAALFFRPLRRRRRIARGQCPACAYSLAGLPAGADKCPECGTAKPT